jgi:hypothetical protein
MNEKALSKLWTFWSSVTTTFGAFAWSRMAGLTVKSDDFGILGRPGIETPLLCVPALSVLVIIGCWLTRHYQQSFGGATWSEHVPIFYFEKADIDVNARDGRIYQGWCVAIFIVFPMICLLVLLARFLSGEIFCNGSHPRAPVAHVHFFGLHGAGCDSFFRFGSVDGPQYYLWFTPWIYLGAVLVAGSYWILTIWNVFIVRKKAGEPMS